LKVHQVEIVPFVEWQGAFVAEAGLEMLALVQMSVA
jgi:hypothetical protein